MHPASVKGSNPRSVSSSSSLLNMNAGRKKGPICKMPFRSLRVHVRHHTSDPFFADFRLANACQHFELPIFGCKSWAVNLLSQCMLNPGSSDMVHALPKEGESVYLLAAANHSHSLVIRMMNVS